MRRLAQLFAQGIAGNLADRPPGRGRHQPRAAASGAPADRYPGAVRRQPAAARLSAGARPRQLGGARADTLDRVSRRHPPGRPRRQGFAWDNEMPAPRRPHPPLPLGRPARHQRRMARVHGRWRLSHGLAVAGGRLGDGQPRRLAGAALLGAARWRMARHVARRPAARRARRPCRHVSYYRGRCLRALGRQAPADRVRVGGGGAGLAVAGNTLATKALRPLPADGRHGTASRAQMFGDVWEWTQSAYLPYPGYRPPAGALGEYNGKFMVSQQVLRGGSARRPTATRAPPTATSSTPTSAGSSWACVLLRRSSDAASQYARAAVGALCARRR